MEPHVALLPSAGMGHLIFLRLLQAMLASRNCKVTLLTAQPTVSAAAESNHLNSFFPAHPHIQRLDFHVLPLQPSNPHDDPFSSSSELSFALFISSSSSIFIIPTHLRSFLDITAATCVDHLLMILHSISYYILNTTSARFFSLITHLPHLTLEGSYKNLQLPGLPSFSLSNVPSCSTQRIFTTQLDLKRSLSPVKGVVSNTFHWFEAETIEALNSGKTSITLPRFLPIGPFKSYEDHGNPLRLEFGDGSSSDRSTHAGLTLNGDQRFNAEVEKTGLGLWPKHWGWLGERLVKSEEIEEKILELMQDHKLRSRAQKVGEEATQAWEQNIRKVLGQIIEMLKLNV
ncbi:hypothetical protein HAX54_052387 [Datura stramonium]|uniref:Uncharacterized protein n=1 Tax=Datura stramonium TaxID=4076 RepID=A0ABS8WND6_DATST|nr:hypothetical protein [Datura stramonium]